jgi:hypothetical protein
MRWISGFVFGVVVTVLGAFVHDSAFSVPPAKPFVNWEQVQESARGAWDGLREQWDRLTR